jgi:hypothetical protein
LEECTPHQKIDIKNLSEIVVRVVTRVIRFRLGKKHSKRKYPVTAATGILICARSPAGEILYQFFLEEAHK